MSIKINYKNNISTKSATNLVLFVDENFNIRGLKKYISNSEFSYIADLLKNSDLKKKILFFEVNSKKKVFFVNYIYYQHNYLGFTGSQLFRLCNRRWSWFFCLF